MALTMLDDTGGLKIKCGGCDACHRSKKLDMFLGKRVRIRAKDGDVMTGILEYGTDERYPKAYKIIRDDGHYDTVFYKSNIKTIDWLY